jgi:hypothetical protein
MAQGDPSMKSMVGMLGVLLLLSTVALAQQYQPLPFPQEANPALQNSYNDETPSAVDLPSAMASDEATVEIFPSAEDSHHEWYRFQTGSPFPMAADPALANGDDRDRKFSDVDTDTEWQDRGPGSPFPTAANEQNW